MFSNRFAGRTSPIMRALQQRSMVQQPQPSNPGLLASQDWLQSIAGKPITTPPPGTPSGPPVFPGSSAMPQQPQGMLQQALQQQQRYNDRVKQPQGTNPMLGIQPGQSLDSWMNSGPAPAAGMNPIMQAMQQQPGSSFGSRSSRPPVPMPQPAAPTPGYGSVPKSRFGGGFGR